MNNELVTELTEELTDIIKQQASNDYYSDDRCTSSKELMNKILDKFIRNNDLTKVIYNLYWAECDKIREQNKNIK